MTTPTGCGWEDDLIEHGFQRPTETNDIPCAARDGYKPCHVPGDDWTIGTVGLCRTCLVEPARLLQRLAGYSTEAKQ